MIDGVGDDADQERLGQRTEQFLVALRPAQQHALRLVLVALGDIECIAHFLI
jgi:hypothetical protein